jgi:hypothetical protein
MEKASPRINITGQILIYGINKVPNIYPNEVKILLTKYCLKFNFNLKCTNKYDFKINNTINMEIENNTTRLKLSQKYPMINIEINPIRFAIINIKLKSPVT